MMQSRDRFAPLLEPGPPLTEDQYARAVRQMQLPSFGELAQRRLAMARVLVIGAGALGSATVPYLAGAGIGCIGIVDDDVVELSNLHRQVAHRTADIGKPKTESLAETALAINPDIRIQRHQLKLTAANAREIFQQYDLVIDGSDNFPTRYLANDAAELTGIPLVWGAILGHHGQVGVAWHKYGPGYRDLFPKPPAPEDVVTCATGGVLPGLCGAIGAFLVTEAMKLITGVGDPLIARVLIYDALAARSREIRYQRDDEAPPVVGLIDYERFCAGESAASAITVDELADQLAISGTLLIDVRTPDERALDAIQPSLFVPLPELELGPLPKQLAQAEKIIVYCAKGPRSIRAAKILREAGLDAVYLHGGIDAYAKSNTDPLTRSLT